MIDVSTQEVNKQTKEVVRMKILQFVPRMETL